MPTKEEYVAACAVIEAVQEMAVEIAKGLNLPHPTAGDTDESGVTVDVYWGSGNYDTERIPTDWIFGDWRALHAAKVQAEADLKAAKEAADRKAAADRLVKAERAEFERLKAKFGT